MKEAIYRIPKGTVEMYEKAGLDHATLAQSQIKTREAETLDELHSLTENSDPANVLKLGQSALDIIVQRQIRNYLESDDAIKLASEQGIGAVVAEAQKISNEYVYGARREGTGASTVTRAKVAATDAALEAIDVSDTTKMDRLRKLLGDKAVEGLIAAKRAADEQAAAKAAKNGQPTA